MAEEVYKSPEVFKNPIKLPKVESSEKGALSTTAPQEDPVYRKKVYNFLKRELSDFKLSEDDFYKKLDTDQAYAPKVYNFLKNNFSDFTKPEQDFLFLMTPSKKKDEIPTVSLSPGEKLPDVSQAGGGTSPSTSPSQSQLTPKSSVTAGTPESIPASQVVADFGNNQPGFQKLVLDDGFEVDTRDPIGAFYNRAFSERDRIARERRLLSEDKALKGGLMPEYRYALDKGMAAPLPKPKTKEEIDALEEQRVKDPNQAGRENDYKSVVALYETNPDIAVGHLSKVLGIAPVNLLSLSKTQIDGLQQKMYDDAMTSAKMREGMIGPQEDISPDQGLPTTTDLTALETLRKIVAAKKLLDNDKWLLITDKSYQQGMPANWFVDRSVEKAAIAYAAETDPNLAKMITPFMRQATLTSADGKSRQTSLYPDPSVYKDAPGLMGQIVYNFLFNPLNEAVAKTSPVAAQFQQARDNFVQNYPKFAAAAVGNKVSQAYEKSGQRGWLSRIAQMDTPGLRSELDETAKQTLSPEEYNIYVKYVRGNEEFLDVPSVLEDLSKGITGVFSGIGNTFTEPFTPTSETQLKNWEQQVTNVSANPVGFWKFTNNAAHMVGFVMGMAAGGEVIKGAQGLVQGAAGTTAALSPTAINMTNAGLVFFGDNLETGKMKYPDDPVKAYASAGFNTALFMALAKDLFPVKQVQSAIRTVAPEVDVVVGQLSTGAISRQVAKAKMQKIYTNAFETLKNATGQNIKVSAEMAGIAAADRGFDAVMGLDKEKYNEYHPANSEIQAFTNMFMGNVGVAAWAGYGKMRYKNRAPIEAYYSVAQKPDFFRKMVEAGEGTPESKKEILENINFIETLKKELDGLGMSESRQKVYIANALGEKAVLARKSADPTLQKKNEQEAGEIRADQEALLQNPGEEIKLTDEGFVPAREEEKPEIKIEPEKIVEEEVARPPAEEAAVVKINDVIGRTGTYKGQKGRLYLDGRTVVFDVEGSNREYVIGDIEAIGEQGVGELGIEAEGKVVSTNENGNLVIRGEELINQFSDPAQAINRNKEGEVISVNLETADGKKRTFRGDTAKDIAAEIEQGRVAGAKIPEGEVPVQKVSEGEVPAGVAEGAPPVRPAEAPVEIASQAPQPKQKTIEEQAAEQQAETERLMAGEAENNRRAGRFVRDGVEYVRNEQGQGEYSDRKGEVRFTNEVSVPFRYKLVEAETLQPSHMGGVRNPNHFIPEAQPKSRLDKGSIMAEEGFASNPRFEELGENTNAFSGAPVVNQRNEVVQGNNRAAGLKRGYERNNPAYKEALKANATKFGFSPSQVEGMKNPVLVREVAVSDAGAIELGNYDVKDLETGGKRRLDPIAVTRRMPMDAKKRLAELLFGGEGTVNQSLRNNFDRVMEILNPLLNQAQRSTIMNKEGNLTEAGAKDIEAVGQQLLFDNGDPALPDLFENFLSQTQKEGIRKSLQHIFAGGSDKNLVREVQNAILALNDFASSGAKDLNQWMSQTDLLRDGKTPRDLYTPLELKIMEILNEAKSQAAIKEKFSAFENAIADKEANMFEPAQKGKSKEEAIKEVFKPEELEAQKTGEVEPKSEKPAEQKPTEERPETPSFTKENIKDELVGKRIEIGGEQYNVDELRGPFQMEEGRSYGNFKDVPEYYQILEGEGDKRRAVNVFINEKGELESLYVADGYETLKIASNERKAETTRKRGGTKAAGKSEGEVPLTEGGEPAKPKGKGKYTQKAEQIAKQIMEAELPSWLKGAELPPGTQKMGPSLPSEEAIKKALANAVIKMGKLLDKGVEFSQAVKEATRDLVKLMGKDKANDIQNNFTDYYNQKNAIPKQEAGRVSVQPEAGAGEKMEGGVPGAEPQKPSGQKAETEGKGAKEITIERPKAFLNAIISAKGTPKAAKEGLERQGLSYKTKNQREAAELAQSIIESQGVEAAVEAAEKELLDGDVNALLMMKSLERLSELEESATSPAEKQKYAIRFAEIANTFDNKARSKGRFNSAIAYFYKKSPLGIVINENNRRKRRFDEWAENKERSWRDFYDNLGELLKDPEVANIIKEKIAEGIAEKTKEGGGAKAGDSLRKFAAAIRKGRISKLGGFRAGTGFDAVWDASVEVVAKAVEGGATLADAIEAGLKYVRGTNWYANLTNKSEFEDKYKKHFESEYAKSETSSKAAERFLESLKKKLPGLSAKQRDEVVKKSLKKIVESGGLDYQEFRDVIGEVTGRGSLTDAEARKMEELVRKTNAIEDASKRVQEERTAESLKDYRIAELEAAKAASELQEMLDTNPNIWDRITSIMQLNTLGIPALINNPIYNVWNQATIRFPVGIVNTFLDQALAKAYASVGKEYVPETNVLNRRVQTEFFKKLGFGTKEAFTQLLTGLNRQDYIQKELTTSKIRPWQSFKSLVKSSPSLRKLAKMFGRTVKEEKLTNTQKIDKALQATVGLPAEIVARTLNLGDKPQRFAAEAATAAMFAETLGLKDLDYQIFIEFPREEAYAQLRKQGLSEAEANERADYIKESIVREGKRSTFQQDNILNDLITKVFSGQTFGGAGNLIKSVAISPYIKIPANAYWSYYNMVNPEVALLQSMVYGARAAKTEGVKSKLAAREARYWFGHAVVGVATRAVVLALVQQGVFNPGTDREETKKEREGKSDFIRQGTVDLDKLSALLRGGDPDKVTGGVLVPLKYLGHWGTIGNAISKKYEEMTPEQRKAQLRFWDAAIGGMELDAVNELQEGIFSNTSSLLSALQDERSLRRYGMNVVNLFTNIVQPAAAAQIERSALSYQSTVKADNFMDELKNNMLQRSAGLRYLTGSQPPAKIGVWGDQLDRKENFMMRWFGISKENKDNFAYPIWELYKKTGDIGYFPPAVLPRLNDQDLTVEQTNRLQELIGKARKSRVAPVINNQGVIEEFEVKFKDLSDENKKFVLQYLYDLGREDGIYQFLLTYPELDPKNEFKNELDYEMNERRRAFRERMKYEGRSEAQIEKMMEDRFKK